MGDSGDEKFWKVLRPLLIDRARKIDCLSELLYQQIEEFRSEIRDYKLALYPDIDMTECIERLESSSDSLLKTRDFLNDRLGEYLHYGKQ